MSNKPRFALGTSVFHADVLLLPLHAGHLHHLAFLISSAVDELQGSGPLLLHPPSRTYHCAIQYYLEVLYLYMVTL